MKKSVLLPLVALVLSSCQIAVNPSSSGAASSEEKSSSPSIEESSFSSATPSSEAISSEVSSIEESSIEESSAASSSEETQVDEDYHPENYHLTWSDEFEGTSLNQNNWTYEIGNGNWGWGNGEAQYYTDHNDSVSDGFLTIAAKREQIEDWNYTSTRIVTKNKAHFTYGYMCARISLPEVQGMWPAFWMLPETGYGSEGTTWWPTSGEIDIMEAKGRIPNKTSGALHFSSNGTGGNHTYRSRENSVDAISNFHVYSVLWTSEVIYWYVDGVVFFSVPSSTWNQGYGTNNSVPFHKDFHFILNLAVGGQFDGNIEPPSDWTQSEMKIDYVRCYQA